MLVCLKVNGGVVTATSGASSTVAEVAAVFCMMFWTLNCFFLIILKQPWLREGKHSKLAPIGCVSQRYPLLSVSLNPVVADGVVI